MHYHECVRKWLQNNPGTVYDKNAFIEVFSEVNKKAATVKNAVSSFCHSGIYPWLTIKEIESSSSGDGKNQVIMTINLDGLINKIIIGRVKYQIVPLGEGDAQPKQWKL